MKIDWQWGKPPKVGNKFTRWAKTCAYMLRDRRKVATPNHMSNHYVRDHFHPEDKSQGRLF